MTHDIREPVALGESNPMEHVDRGFLRRVVNRVDRLRTGPHAVAAPKTESTSEHPPPMELTGEGR
jgi:hypothetical protein